MGARYLKTQEEILRKLYPTASKSEILEAIPDRGWVALSHHAQRMGIVRTKEAKGREITLGRKREAMQK